MATSARGVLERILDGSGVAINGPHPWDMQVHDSRFFSRVLRDKNLGLGEAYMAGWWDCDRLDDMTCRLLAAGLDRKLRDSPRLLLMGAGAVIGEALRSRSRRVARRHYDLDRALFHAFLDPYHQYSCGFFEGTERLAEAQENKLALIRRKLDLRPGDELLDIGFGWGGLARYMAEKVGCRVTGVNISEEQHRFAREFCAGLPVRLKLCDFRDLRGGFDKIVSVGMLEHVNVRNYRRFMATVQRCLKPNGLFLLQTIGTNESQLTCDPWISRYIFPDSMLPSLTQISRSVEGLFVIEDLHNLGPHYDKTLMAWHRNFQAAWPQLAGRFDAPFKRMWDYYLLTCAGAFRARSIQLWQLVFTRCGTSQPCCRF